VVGVVESRPPDLTLKNQDLVSKCEDFGISGDPGRENPSDSSEDKPASEAMRGTRRRGYRSRRRHETCGMTGRMNLRHLQARISGSRVLVGGAP